MAGLKTCTRFRAMVARRRRRISSSLLPENMGPQITSIQPRLPVTISMSATQIERLAARWNLYRDLVAFLDQLRERLLGGRLAMYQEYLLQARRDRGEPFEQLALAGVPAQLEQGRDLRPAAHGLTKNVDLRPLFHQLATERIFRLEAGDEDRIARILDVVTQVMQDAPRLAHSR